MSPQATEAVSIYEPVAEGLERVKSSLLAVGNVSSDFQGELLVHALDSTGKRVRPAITLLAAGFHPHDSRVVETMALAVELLHIATLIHDDTVDNSDLRRGRATLSAVWGRNAAVLIGDYLFAKSAVFVCDTGNIGVIRRFAETIMELSSGELQESVDAHESSQTREKYLARIYNKTASLFTTAAQSGAVLSGAPEATAQKLRSYGYNVGMAFQIVDDILDFEGDAREVGKPVGSDLAQGILTLPAIIALEEDSGGAVGEALQNPDDSDRLIAAVERVVSSTAIEDSHAVAREYCDRALSEIVDLQENEFRSSLEALAEYIVARRS